MIHSASPQMAVKICFLLVDFEKCVQRDKRTDNMCEYSDHSGRDCGSAEWIKQETTNVSFLIKKFFVVTNHA